MTPWRLMSRFVLRSTGFPLELLDRLRLPESAELAERVCAATDTCAAEAITLARRIGADPELRRTERAVRKRLTRGDTPDPQWTEVPWLARELAGLAASAAERDRLRAHAESVFAAELHRARQELRALADEPRIEEALWLSNPAVVDNELAAIRQHWDVDDPHRRARIKRWERRLYSYLQRLAAKNDTTSFFGPLNYGRFHGAEPVLRFARERIVRRRSFVAFRAARRLAEVTTGTPLRESTVDPLGDLTSAVSALPETPDTARWSAELAELTRLGEAFSGTPWPGRRQFLRQAEARYARLTGDAPLRGDGAMFRDRTLFYEECLGDLSTVDLGAATGREIVEALAPVLDLCAGYTAGVWADWRDAAIGLVEGRWGRAAAVPLPRFLVEWRRAHPTAPPSPRGDRVLRELTALVRRRADGAVCRLTADEVRAITPPADEDVLGSPDVMLAAPNFAAVARGDYRLVLGELHHGAQPVGWMLTLADDAPDWEAELAEHLPIGPDRPANLVFRRRMKVAPPEFPGPSVRAGGHAEGGGGAVWDLADLEVSTEDGLALRVAATGERLRFYAPSFGVPDDAYAAFACFSYPLLRVPSVRLGEHTPRVEVDGVVLARRRWEVPSERLPRATGFDALIEATRLRAELDLPERLYVRSPAEPKPVYADLTCLFSLELLAHLAGGAPRLVCEEMLPGPDELWLRRPDGHYCSELRTVVSRRGAS